MNRKLGKLAISDSPARVTLRKRTRPAIPRARPATAPLNPFERTARTPTKWTYGFSDVSFTSLFLNQRHSKMIGTSNLRNATIHHEKDCSLQERQRETQRQQNCSPRKSSVKCSTLILARGR